MTTHLHDRVMSEETLDLSSKEAVLLGPGLILSRCRVRLTTNEKALTIGASRFEDCEIEAKRGLTNVRWCNAWLERSKFLGVFTGCDFGRWPEHYDPNGGIKDCDFSESVLDGCRFFGEHASTMKWPPWPCFVIESPKKAVSRMKALKWPGKLEHWVAGLDWSPAETKAAVLWAPDVVKRFGGTESQLRELLMSAGVLADQALGRSAD